MKNEKTVSVIQITSETRRRISLDNYKELTGTKNENILCAIIVNVGTIGVPLTAENFLMLYNWMVGTLHQGIVIDFSLHPHMKGSLLLKEARLMKGNKTENLIKRDSCIKIANFISDNNEIFAKELDSSYTEFEIKLLLFSFSPGCAI